jgi:hypothetical protein
MRRYVEYQRGFYPQYSSDRAENSNYDHAGGTTTWEVVQTNQRSYVLVRSVPLPDAEQLKSAYDDAHYAALESAILGELDSVSLDTGSGDECAGDSGGAGDGGDGGGESGGEGDGDGEPPIAPVQLAVILLVCVWLAFLLNPEFAAVLKHLFNPLFCCGALGGFLRFVCNGYRTGTFCPLAFAKSVLCGALLGNFCPNVLTLPDESFAFFIGFIETEAEQFVRDKMVNAYKHVA